MVSENKWKHLLNGYPCSASNPGAVSCETAWPLMVLNPFKQAVIPNTSASWQHLFIFATKVHGKQNHSPWRLATFSGQYFQNKNQPFACRSLLKISSFIRGIAWGAGNRAETLQSFRKIVRASSMECVEASCTIAWRRLGIRMWMS